MIDKAAPEFTLPAVHREGQISLADYRGRSHLLLAIFAGQWPQRKGQFLIDRDGMIRWANIESTKGIADIGKFPTDEELLAIAARIA